MSWWGQYVGLPFAVANCWQLVRRVFADQRGVVLPEHGDISAEDLVAIARGMQAEAGRAHWQGVNAPVQFDVATMRKHRLIIHVGVVTRPGWVLHTEQTTGAVHVPVSHFSVAGRIVGYQRYQA